VLQYDDFIPGNFLGVEDDVEYNVTTISINPNRVSVELSRMIPNDGQFGDGRLITMKFRIVESTNGSTSSPIQFTDQLLIQPNGQKLDLGKWWGGTVVTS
jgi:hypothetical protein